ncbi:putative Major facilitator superfamily MFS_1 [Acidobacteriia bacterium SbA2]|nr:putative Major facilitator superfamily MFS_1 [Acidobacteriia bacterium SbA2]
MTAVPETPSAPIPTAPTSTNKRLVLLLMAVTSVGYVCRVAVTVVAPNMMKEFGLTQAQMGTVFSAFLVGYTFFQIPSGGLADRVSARRIFLVLCAGWALLTALTALVGWRGFGLAMVIPQLWLIRALFGVVAAPTYPTSGRTIAITMPPRLQARANSLVLASVGVGSAVTPLLLAPITGHYGWRMALGVAALLGVVAGVLWWRFGPREFHSREISNEPPAANNSAPTASPAASPQPLRSPSFWFLSASYLLQGYLGYIFVFWFYLYLVQVRHFEVLKAASFTALPWIATMFAIPLGGVLSDAAVTRWGATWGRRSVPLAALCAAAIFLVIGARTPNPMVAVAALTTCTVLVLCTEGPFWATMTQLSGEHSGIAGGTMNFGSNLGGMVSPALTPWLAERIGWGTALSLTAAGAIVAGLLWLGVNIHVASDAFVRGRVETSAE